MKIEVRCPSCGRGYLVDEAKIPATGGVVRCQVCDAAIPLRPSQPTAPPPSASFPTPKPAAPQPTAPVAKAPVPKAAMPHGEIVCPRCGLHFMPAAVPLPKPAGARPVVLVVEDMEYFVEIARDALSAKYEVRVARSIAEALAAAHAGPVDVMLLDLTLDRGEDGADVLRALPGRTFPVLVFTAQDESEMYGETWQQLQTLGVSDVVRKGFNMGEMLLRKVGALLGETEAPDTLNR